jgi:hypothetical protein
MHQETILQNQIRIALSEFGICIRLNTGIFMTADNRVVKCGLPGMPDLLWLGPGGRSVWLEVKTGSGIISPAQQRFMARLRELGHTAEIVRSLDEALVLIGR